MIPTISQVCSLNSPLKKDIEDYAAGRCESVEIWLTKLEGYLQKNPPDQFLKLLEEHQIKAHVASFQGGLLASQGDQRHEAWRLLDQRLRLCQELGISTLVVACDVPLPLTAQVVERAQGSLRELAERAAHHATRIALEFQAHAAFGNNLQTAAALVDQVGSQQLGICLDLFHFYVGPSKLDDLALLTADNLFHVQVSDVADVPREVATDSHRILPGEGDIAWPPILDHLRAINYTGCVSLEIMNPLIWQVPALQLGEIGMTSLRKLLGLAG